MLVLNPKGNFSDTSHPFIPFGHVYKWRQVHVSHPDALKVLSCTVLVNLYAKLMENCPNGQRCVANKSACAH